MNTSIDQVNLMSIWIRRRTGWLASWPGRTCFSLSPYFFAENKNRTGHAGRTPQTVGNAYTTTHWHMDGKGSPEKNDTILTLVLLRISLFKVVVVAVANDNQAIIRQQSAPKIVRSVIVPRECRKKIRVLQLVFSVPDARIHIDCCWVVYNNKLKPKNKLWNEMGCLVG